MDRSFINVIGTGENIYRLMWLNNLSVKDVQAAFGFTTPQAIYKWINGKNLPSLDNLVNLARIFKCKVDDILVVDTVSLLK